MVSSPWGSSFAQASQNLQLVGFMENFVCHVPPLPYKVAPFRSKDANCWVTVISGL